MMIQLKMKALQSLLEKNIDESETKETIEHDAKLVKEKSNRKTKTKNLINSSSSQSDIEEQELEENYAGTKKLKRKLESKTKRSKLERLKNNFKFL